MSCTTESGGCSGSSVCKFEWRILRTLGRMTQTACWDVQAHGQCHARSVLLGKCGCLTSGVALCCGLDIARLCPIGGMLCAHFEGLQSVHMHCVSLSQVRVVLVQLRGKLAWRHPDLLGCVVLLLLDILAKFWGDRSWWRGHAVDRGRGCGGVGIVLCCSVDVEALSPVEGLPCPLFKVPVCTVKALSWARVFWVISRQKALLLHPDLPGTRCASLARCSCRVLRSSEVLARMRGRWKEGWIGWVAKLSKTILVRLRGIWVALHSDLLGFSRTTNAQYFYQVWGRSGVLARVCGRWKFGWCVVWLSLVRCHVHSRAPGKSGCRSAASAPWL